MRALGEVVVEIFMAGLAGLGAHVIFAEFRGRCPIVIGALQTAAKGTAPRLPVRQKRRRLRLVLGMYRTHRELTGAGVADGAAFTKRIGVGQEMSGEGASAWQPVQAAVMAGAGLIRPCGLTVGLRPSGRVCSLLLTWHTAQFSVSVGVPVGPSEDTGSW